MGRKKVLGIRVSYPLSDFGFYFQPHFYIAYDFPSEHFISSPMIRKTLSEYEKKTTAFIGTEIGNMKLTYNGKSKTTTWGAYHPIKPSLWKLFLGKGIAQWLELIVIKDMKKEFPELKKFKHTAKPSHDRIQQLKKRGFKSPFISWKPPYLTYSYEEAVSALRKQILKGRSKARKKKVRKVKLVRVARRALKKTVPKKLRRKIKPHL